MFPPRPLDFPQSTGLYLNKPLGRSLLSAHPTEFVLIAPRYGFLGVPRVFLHSMF